MSVPLVRRFFHYTVDIRNAVQNYDTNFRDRPPYARKNMKSVYYVTQRSTEKRSRGITKSTVSLLMASKSAFLSSFDFGFSSSSIVS